MRTELPSGTVTFLFTDVEGSTRLLHELGEERYAEVLAEHRLLLRGPFRRHGGVEVDTQGDAFFYAFARASDALTAADAGRRALEPTPVRVRIGVHTGEPVVTDEGYVGMDVHKAARIAAAGHGGQVLVSEQTARLAGPRNSLLLRDLGLHRLKDLSAPERIYQLGGGEFARLKTLHQTNLPVPANPLVGRERELPELSALLRERRLVTLTGPGGTGKTRLAVQAAAEVADEFPDGVFWVPLQALADAALLLPAVASALGARGELAEHLAPKRILLLLDNFEQLLPEAAVPIAELVGISPAAAVLVTSRAPLRIAAECEYVLAPLPLRDAVTLFGQRAAQAEPAEAVVEICRRLEGLPLALELAAARTRLLPPAKLLERLTFALPLLTSGARDAPERQRTLSATIQWSYDLLSEDEKRLFRRLSVFAGGFELEAAEEVAEADLGVVENLVDHSLVRRWTSGRLGMLETIREYAIERLRESGELEPLRRRHAMFFRSLVRSAGEHLVGEDQELWYAALEREHANIRSALGHLQRHDRNGELALVAGLWRFWLVRGYVAEGRGWLDAALTSGDGDPALRAAALNGAAWVARSQGDLDAAEHYARLHQRIARESGNTLHVARATVSLAAVATHRGDLGRAVPLGREAVRLLRDLGEGRALAVALGNVGYTLTMSGDPAGALEPLQEALTLYRRAGDLNGNAIACLNLGMAYYFAGDRVAALSSFLEALRASRRLGHREFVAYALQGLAAATALEEPQGAARLVSAGTRLLNEIGVEPPPIERRIRDAAVGTIRDSLGSGGEAALDIGGALDEDEAVQLALASID